MIITRLGNFHKEVQFPPVMVEITQVQSENTIFYPLAVDLATIPAHSFKERSLYLLSNSEIHFFRVEFHSLTIFDLMYMIHRSFGANCKGQSSEGHCIKIIANIILTLCYYTCSRKKWFNILLRGHN